MEEGESNVVALSPAANQPTNPPTHPLNAQWTWSYKPTIVYKAQSAEDWMSDYRPVIPRTFDTAEEFWGIYQHLPSLPALDIGNIYAVFKDGIQPTWEDVNNEHGYSVVLYPNKNNDDNYIGELYRAALLLLVTAGGDEASVMNGCTFERKAAGNKIVFWMAGGGAAAVTTVKSILSGLNVPKTDTKLTDNAARIDWKDKAFSSFKIAIKCVSHQKRANEPPPQRSGSATTTTQPQRGGSAANNRSRNHRPPAQQQQQQHHRRRQDTSGDGERPPRYKK